MTDPGRLKTRLVIQMPVEIDDGQGGTTRNFTTQATVWAAVMPATTTAANKVEAGAEGAAVRYRIILRSNFSLTTQHRLIDGERTYRIAAIRDIDDGRFIEIDAELRVE